MNPQDQFPQGYGAQTPNSAVNFDNKNIINAVQNARPEQLDVSSTTNGSVQMNVVNAVNANGIVSGRKVVDFIWQRVAICMIVLTAGFVGATITTIIIANSYNNSAIRLETEKESVNEQLSELYSALKVDNHSDALTTIAKDEILTGTDIKSIRSLITEKYGSVTSFDATDDAVNLVKTNGIYRVVSLKIVNAAVSRRVLAYAKVSDGQWKMAEYDSLDEKNPCKNSSDEEKAAITGIVVCPTEVSDEEPEEESVKAPEGKTEE